ncbi:MAG TPA: response regulator transcription factor [Solirubrobacteraceae bacterium]|nr:response regulator transcription factor [Solirubrobacteraceae bacterium]
MRILVAEDEPAIADFIEHGLKAEGYAVAVATDGGEALKQALAEDFALIVLDRMLPTLDGVALLRELRRNKPDQRVIMLTARSGIDDRVEGLDAGAIDYMTKPFAFDELAARVRAHLRMPSQNAPTRLLALGIELDLLSRRVTRDGVEVTLSSKEFELLAYFMRHPQNVLSREQILSAVWGYSHDPGTNIVEVYVSYLRRKLSLPGSPAPIVTVRSVGYRLAPSRA